MPASLEARVVEALAQIRNPRLENDLLSAGMIRDLTVTDAGGVSFTFLLAPEDPATLVRQAIESLEHVVPCDGQVVADLRPLVQRAPQSHHVVEEIVRRIAQRAEFHCRMVDLTDER